MQKCRAELTRPSLRICTTSSTKAKSFLIMELWVLRLSSVTNISSSFVFFRDRNSREAELFLIRRCASFTVSLGLTTQSASFTAALLNLLVILELDFLETLWRWWSSLESWEVDGEELSWVTWDRTSSTVTGTSWEGSSSAKKLTGNAGSTVPKASAKRSRLPPISYNRINRELFPDISGNLKWTAIMQ